MLDQHRIFKRVKMIFYEI